MKALVVVETREAALVLFPGAPTISKWPIRDGLMTEDHIHAEVGDLISGTRVGWTSTEQIDVVQVRRRRGARCRRGAPGAGSDREAGRGTGSGNLKEKKAKIETRNSPWRDRSLAISVFRFSSFVRLPYEIQT